jgi:AraC-like DNA-binding protein
MTGARSIAAMVSDPVGRFRVGTTYVVWCASPTLCGSVHWGRPSERDVRELMELFDPVHPALDRGHDFIMDTHALDSLDWLTLIPTAEYLRSRFPAWGRRIKRLAMVMPSGPLGVTVAGITQAVSFVVPPYPVRLCATSADALGWLQRADAFDALGEIERLVEETRGIAPIVRTLRDYLAGSLASPTVDDAARVCGVAPRSLQRELRRHGTSFGAELETARLRAARELLQHSDEKIETIARRVGYPSSSRLSALFRKTLGETPAQYRQRTRPT